MGEIHGLKFNRELSVTHLLFADDSLVFTRASTTNCRNLKQIFVDYAAASGQVINYDKSSMFFSSGANQSQMEEIKSIFGLNVDNLFNATLPGGGKLIVLCH